MVKERGRRHAHGESCASLRRFLFFFAAFRCQCGPRFLTDSLIQLAGPPSLLETAFVQTVVDHGLTPRSGSDLQAAVTKDLFLFGVLSTQFFFMFSMIFARISSPRRRTRQTDILSSSASVAKCVVQGDAGTRTHDKVYFQLEKSPTLCSPCRGPASPLLASKVAPVDVAWQDARPHSVQVLRPRVAELRVVGGFPHSISTCLSCVATVASPRRLSTSLISPEKLKYWHFL